MSGNGENSLPTIEGYTIEGLLGSGAMGAVYKATQESMGRMVALKVIHSRFAEDGEYVERFLREARSMGKLNHPNVVQGYDSGKSNGFYFLAMEYVEGESLNQYLERHERLSEEQARKVALDVTQALQHAHERKLIHRDIKPSNIIGMADGRNKVTDFGLARATEDPSLTMAGQTVGTPLYIAPELIDGSKPVTIKCDIYSLGATLYHLLAGLPPFEAKTATAVMTKHLRENALPLAERLPNLSVGFSRFVARLMTKNFDLRPQNPAVVLAMLDELEPLVDLNATVVDLSRFQSAEDDVAFAQTIDGDTLENHLQNLPGEFSQEGQDTEPQERPAVPTLAQDNNQTAPMAFRETLPNLPEPRQEGADTLPPVATTLSPQPVAPVAPTPPPAPIPQAAPPQPERSGKHTPPQSSSPKAPARESRPSFVAKPVLRKAPPPPKKKKKEAARMSLAKSFGLVFPSLLIAFGGAYLTRQILAFLPSQYEPIISPKIYNAIALGAGVLGPLACVRLLENPPLLGLVGLSGLVATAIFPVFGFFEVTKEIGFIIVALLSGWATLTASAAAEGSRGREFPQSSLGAIFLFFERLAIAAPLFAIYLCAGFDLFQVPIFIAAKSQLAVLIAMLILGTFSCLPAFELAKTVAATAPQEEEDDPISAREGLRRPRLVKDEKTTTVLVLGIVGAVVACLLIELVNPSKGVASLRYVWAALFIVPVFLASNFASTLLTRPLSTAVLTLFPMAATVQVLRWHRLYRSLRLTSKMGQGALALGFILTVFAANAFVERVCSRKKSTKFWSFRFLVPRLLLGFVFQGVLITLFLMAFPNGAPMLKVPLCLSLAFAGTVVGGTCLEWSKWHLYRVKSSEPLLGASADWIVRPPV